jgi:hypothetical protein
MGWYGKKNLFPYPSPPVVGYSEVYNLKVLLSKIGIIVIEVYTSFFYLRISSLRTGLE